MKIQRYRIGIMSVTFVIMFMAACSKRNPLYELEEWDLVYISDSTGWGVAEIYAKNIERDTGKTVRVHNYAIDSLPALKILNALQSGTETITKKEFDTLQADIANAEVIVFFGNPRGDPSEGGVTGGMEKCISGRNAPDDCTSELYEPYIENLKAIYEEILALRDGKPTIIRAVDFYNPLISSHRARNIEVECTQCFEIVNSAVRQAADACNIPLVSVYDAFNGTNHDEDPREKGYIGSDGIHASIQGRQVIADLLSEVGYEPIES
jgi:hypothetical protein